jgi:hypothetical protein
MLALYDYSKFPEVKVTFKGNLTNESEFLLFCEQWKQLYKDKREFTFIFDMKDIGYVYPFYCYKMSTFISELKKEQTQYVTSSTIINVNTYMKYLLHVIFSIQKPVAPVYIHTQDGTISVVTP